MGMFSANRCSLARMKPRRAYHLAFSRAFLAWRMGTRVSLIGQEYGRYQRGSSKFEKKLLKETDHKSKQGSHSITFCIACVIVTKHATTIITIQPMKMFSYVF